MNRTDRYLACAAQHFGPWAIQHRWFASAVSMVKAGTYPRKTAMEDGDYETPPPPPLYIVENGIAIVSIDGQITKGESSFGGASSVRTRQAIRKAVQDESVKAIMLHIDSPGGTVAGTQELADDVAKAGAMKPIAAHADDLMASAAYWVGTQASFLSVNSTGFVGCIGAMAVVEDSSDAAEKMGFKVYLVTSDGGEEYKGAFSPGVPVTEKHLAYLKGQLNDLNEFFLQAVARGRKMSVDDVRKIADGRDWIGATAKQMGLVDDVMSFEQAMARLSGIVNQPARQSSRAQRIRMAELS